MTHDRMRTRPGLMPVRSSSSSLSTTARIAVPIRVARKKTNNALAEAKAMAMVMNWSLLTRTAPSSCTPEGRKRGKFSAVAP
jgi:hypothetical protein